MDEKVLRKLAEVFYDAFIDEIRSELALAKQAEEIFEDDDFVEDLFDLL